MKKTKKRSPTRTEGLASVRSAVVRNHCQLLLLLLLLLLVPSSGEGQDSVERIERIESSEELAPFDRGPADHLGWGTLEDQHVDLGAGAAVSVFPGNLVVSIQPFPRADALADSQFGFTYNHVDSDGSSELGAGWTHDLARFVSTGAWGDKVLVDGDGFRDSFLSGPPPSAQEAMEVIEAVASEWRKSTPLRQRRQAGGVPALRAALASDPLFLAELRLRFLGAPSLPPDPDRRWRSGLRGEREIWQDERRTVLRRGDGGTETYSLEGFLQRIDPQVGPAIELQHEGGAVSEVRVGGNLRYRVLRDSMGRVASIRSTQGQEIELLYLGRFLHRLDGPAGSWRFTYDAGGRLVGMDSPQGLVVVSYDAKTGGENSKLTIFSKKLPSCQLEANACFMGRTQN